MAQRQQINKVNNALHSVHSRLSTLFQNRPGVAWLILACVWVLAHPWFGFWHDGMLYLGQALHLASPENYVGDPFFMYGSQDDFTLFTKIYAALIKQVGAAPAGQVIMLIAVVSWFAAIYAYWKTAFRDNPSAACAIALMLFLPTGYGGWNIFTYAEPFLTARSVGEPLVIAGLCLLLQGKNWAALGTLLLAALAHPLVAMSGMMVWFFHTLLYPSRLWQRAHVALLALSSIIVAGVLVILRVGPFAHINATYQQDWFNLVQIFNRDVFISYWHLADWWPVASMLVLYGIHRRFLPSSAQQRMMTALLVATVVACTLSFLLGDILRNVLALSMQLWRIFWILRVLVPATVAIDIIRAHKKVPRQAVWATAFAFSSLMAVYPVLFYTLLAVAIALAICPTIPMRAGLHKCIYAICWAIFIFMIGQRYINEALFIKIQFLTTRYSVLYPHLVVILIGLTALLVVSWISSRFITGLLLFTLIFSTLVTWDRRPDTEIFFESAVNRSPFNKYVRPDETIYWNVFRPLAWVVFNRSSYVSGMVASAFLFNHDFAAEFMLRQSAIGQHYVGNGCDAIDFGQGVCADNAKTINPDLCRLDDRIHWIVSDYKSPLPATSHWQFAVPGFPHGLYLYSCKDWLKLPAKAVTKAAPANPAAPVKATP